MIKFVLYRELGGIVDLLYHNSCLDRDLRSLEAMLCFFFCFVFFLLCSVLNGFCSLVRQSRWAVHDKVASHKCQDPEYRAEHYIVRI